MLKWYHGAVHLALPQIKVLLAEREATAMQFAPASSAMESTLKVSLFTISRFGTPKAAPQHSILKA